jgi:hypothetical protein
MFGAAQALFEPLDSIVDRAEPAQQFCPAPSNEQN